MSVRSTKTTPQDRRLRDEWVKSITDTQEALKVIRHWNDARDLVAKNEELVAQRRAQFTGNTDVTDVNELWLLLYDTTWRDLCREYSDEHRPENGRNPRFEPALQSG